MRDSVLFCAVLLLFAGCEFFETGISDRRPRHDGDDNEDTGSIMAPSRIDTSVYICGVRILDDYDWRRDTAFGIPNCELVVLRDGALIMAVPCRRGSGVTPDTDRHFLIDGDLFSYECPGDSTLICRNGRPILHYPSKEKLCGIIYRDQSWYTLGLGGSPGGALRLRRNGQTVWIRDGATSDCSFGGHMQSRYGAFVEGAEGIVFSFSENGVDYLYNEGSISVIQGSQSLLAGKYIIPLGAVTTFYNSSAGHCLIVWTKWGIHASSSSGTKFISGRYYRFSNYLATDAMGETTVLLNPMGEKRPPMIWCDGEVTTPDIPNGYLTGVETVIGPAR